MAEPIVGRYLTLAQAARILGLNRGTLSNQVRAGKLRAINVSPPGVRAVYLVPVEEIERYRKEHLGRRGRPRKQKPPAGTTEGAP